MAAKHSTPPTSSDAFFHGLGHGLPRHHRPGKVRSRFSEETFAGVSSRDGVAPVAAVEAGGIEPRVRPSQPSLELREADI
jgi:hypothetical protein